MFSTRTPYVLFLLALLFIEAISHRSVHAAYPPDPRTDLQWDYARQRTVQDIQMQFNRARANENRQLGCSLPEMRLPDQIQWNRFTDNERALWLINSERKARGLRQLDGIERNVTQVAQSYAQYLLETDLFDHRADGRSPWERLDSVPRIQSCRDYLRVAENLAVFWVGSTLPLEQAVYMWMYSDSGSDWGHRHTILWRGFNDNSGSSGKEGFLGIGRATGLHHGYPDTQIVVMNVFDPCPDWR
jgi:uncharacterized protein YkwD